MLEIADKLCCSFGQVRYGMVLKAHKHATMYAYYKESASSLMILLISYVWFPSFYNLDVLITPLQDILDALLHAVTNKDSVNVMLIGLYFVSASAYVCIHAIVNLYQV